MRVVYGPILALAMAAPSIGVPADPPPIRVPSGPMLPPPSSDVAVKLSAETLYVIDADVPVRVLSSPAGFVRIVKEQGPIRIRGKFVDGSGKPETRTYAGKWVYFIEPAQTGRVELLIVPTEAANPDDSDVIRRTLDVDAGEGPRPPPEPNPPDPQPVNPAPIPVDGFRVLIIYDRTKLGVLPASQNAIFFSQEIDNYCKTKCVKGPDGKTPEFRQYSIDADLSRESQLWQTAFKRPRKWSNPENNTHVEGYTPWIIISTGKTGYEGPLPLSVDDTLKLLKKYGGE